MQKMFSRLADWPFGFKAAILFLYGFATFVAVWYIGNFIYTGGWTFRGFEALWLIHMVIIVNQVQRSQREYFFLGVIAVSAGLVHNILDVISLL